MTIIGNRFALNTLQRLGVKLVRQIGNISSGADEIRLARKFHTRGEDRARILLKLLV